MAEAPAPVFTVKLYRSSASDSTSIMVLAARLEIQRLAEDSVRINVLNEHGAALESHFVGAGQGAYSWAVIENPSGRTTEVIRPRVRQVVLRG